jgi:hypothetical protein
VFLLPLAHIIMLIIPLQLSAQCMNSAFTVAGSNMGEAVRSIARDASGVYVTGFFSGTADFDPSASVTNRTSNGGIDAFVAKYTHSGALIWVKTFGGVNNDESNDLVISGGAVYITGQVRSTGIDFNVGGTPRILSFGSEVTFIARYDAATGDCSFVNGMNVSGQGGTGIGVDSGGNIIIFGEGNSFSDFDINVGGIQLATGDSNAGGNAVFLVKYNSSGAYLWGITFGGNFNDKSYKLAIDAGNNILVTGAFWNTCNFNPLGGAINRNATGNGDGFLAKYNPSGVCQWVVQIGDALGTFGGHDHNCNGLTVDASNTVYVGGFFSRTVDFDPGVGTANLTSAGGRDGFLASYSPTGTYNWVQNIGTGASESHTVSLSLNGSGSIMVAGYFVGTADFDPSVGVFNRTALTSFDDFLGEYTAATGAFIRVITFGGGWGGWFNKVLAQGTDVLYGGTFSGTMDVNPSSGTYNLTSAGAEDVWIGRYSFGASSTTYTWNGGTADWQTPTSWTPTRDVGCDQDILQFNTGTHTPTNVPTETIQQLRLNAGAQVTLQGTVAGNTLTIGTGGVQVPAASTLCNAPQKLDRK